jgi:AcrR family transcriptional regulator
MTTQSRYPSRRTVSSPAKDGGEGRPARGSKARPGKPGGVRETNRKAREEALSSAAMHLFLARGIEETTIDEITHAAGMAKGSFYRYYGDKRALVSALFEPVSAEIEAAMVACRKALEDPVNRDQMVSAWKTLGDALASTIFSHIGVVRLYLQESRGPASGARAPVVAASGMIGRHAIEITRQAHVHGILRPIHPAVSALAVVGAVERLLSALFSGEDVGNPLEIPAALTTLIVEGLRADEPRPARSKRR